MCVCRVILLFVNECECKEKTKCECKKVVYLKVLRDVLCESVEIKWLVDYVTFWVQYRCSDYEMKSDIKK